MDGPIMSRGYQSSIDNTPIENWKLRFAIDSAILFMDLENSRIEFTDFVRGLTYNEIVSLSKPLGKIYLSSDTHQILSYDFYNEKWIVYGENSYNSNITDVSYNENNGNIIITINDRYTREIVNTFLVDKIKSVEDRISKLEKIIAKYEESIEIIDKD